MSDKWFSLELKEEKLRKMNRQEYYEAMSWLRKTRRAMMPRLPPQEYFDDMYRNLAIYGNAANLQRI